MARRLSTHNRCAFGQTQRRFVPDAETAQRIAEAVAGALYAEEKARRERPYRGRLRGNVWTVLGTDNPPLALGGNAILQINKIDGRVIFAHHTE